MDATDIRLEMTCNACPEQYDAFVGDRQVGYLRLRHGTFTVRTPDPGGVCVYAAETIGDGVFEASEREYHLTRAKESIVTRLMALPYLTSGQSSEQCLDDGLVCSIDPLTGKCTECGIREDKR